MVIGMPSIVKLKLIDTGLEVSGFPINNWFSTEYIPKEASFFNQ